MNLPQEEISLTWENENPFFHRGPIRDRRYFLGRTEETRRALQMLRNGQCVSVLGPRRIGETSFLFHLCDPEVQTQHGLGEQYLFIYLDCQGMRDTDKSGFYRRMWESTKKVLAEKTRDSRPDVASDASFQIAEEVSVTGTMDLTSLVRLHQLLAGRFDEGELRTLCFDLRIDYDDLPGKGKADKARELVAYLDRRGHIRDLVAMGEQTRMDISWEDIFKKASEAAPDLYYPPEQFMSDFHAFEKSMAMVFKKGYKPIFLIDEFEIAAQNHSLDLELFSNLRSLVPSVAYVTASQDSLYDLTYADSSVLGSPFFNVFEKIYLGSLQREEAEEMVSGMLRMVGQDCLFTENDLAFVFTVGGYYPFFLQLACYHLFERRIERGELASQDYGCVRQRYADDAEAHFRYIWHHLEEDEKASIRLVCEGKGKCLSYDQRRRLRRKCILDDESGFFSSAFAAFVSRQVSGLEEAEVGELEVEKISLFLSYAREDEERVKVLYQKLHDEGFMPWMDIMDILPGEKWQASVRRAIGKSDFFLVCLSAKSVNKRGSIQKEIKDALGICQEMLDTDIYLIPVRLEDSDLPEILQGFQWVNLFGDDGWAKLVRAIRIGAQRRV